MKTIPAETIMNNQETLNFQLSLLKLMTRLENPPSPQPASPAESRREQALEALVARVNAPLRDRR